jgi:hypothetical protein
MQASTSMTRQADLFWFLFGLTVYPLHTDLAMWRGALGAIASTWWLLLKGASVKQLEQARAA